MWDVPQRDQQAQLACQAHHSERHPGEISPMPSSIALLISFANRVIGGIPRKSFFLSSPPQAASSEGMSGMIGSYIAGRCKSRHQAGVQRAAALCRSARCPRKTPPSSFAACRVRIYPARAVWITIIITWFLIIVTWWLRRPLNGLEAVDTM